MTPEISYDKNVPPEIREPLDPLLRHALKIAPTWLHRVYVDWSDQSASGEYLSTNVREEYRHMTLFIHPGFLMGYPDERAHDLTHEIVHTLLEPMVSFGADLIDRVSGEDATLQEWAREQWRRRLEGVVCDVTRALLEGSGSSQPKENERGGEADDRDR